MDLDLVGYLCNLLDLEERARTEAALCADPAMSARLERLRANIAPLAYAETDPPPVGLADRTLARVFNRPTPSTRIPATLGSDREPAFAPSRWRRPAFSSWSAAWARRASSNCGTTTRR